MQTLEQALQWLADDITGKLSDPCCPSCGIGNARCVAGATVVDFILRDGVDVRRVRFPLLISCDFCTWTREMSTDYEPTRRKAA